MSKAKEYTKMILNRLSKKADKDNLKSTTSSNQKTQATPSSHHDSPKNARQFFDNFDKNCAVYHQPVLTHAHRKPLKRPMYFQLLEIKNRGEDIMQGFKKDVKRTRMATEPHWVSEFTTEEPKKIEYKVPKVGGKDIREYKSITCRKVEERPSSKQVYQSQLVPSSRYRSLKTLPSKSSVYSQVGAHRRILVSPSSLHPFQRKDSHNYYKKDYRMERKREEPRRELMHRCESFEKFLAQRP